jgi:hypothetical protein
MMSVRGLSQLGGILRLRFNYAPHERRNVRSANKPPRCPALLRNDTFADIVQYELRRIVEVQFLQDVGNAGAAGENRS